MPTAEVIDIRRPTEDDWDGIIAVLKTANFHAIGSEEMESFPLSDCFVAVADGRIVGVGGYRILDADTGKTTLLAVHPDWREHGIGMRLQRARLDVMIAAGVKRIYTNTDDERVVEWARRHFGFRRTGKTIPKVHSFGDPTKDHWINIVLELEPGKSAS